MKVVSEIRETKKRVVIGIDEAGRGPVVGPMVYGVFIMETAVIEDKGRRRVYRDSKEMRPEQRRRLFEELKLENGFDYAYIEVDPMHITMCMNRGVRNLNEIARDAVVALLEEVRKKCGSVERVYVDGLGNNEKYEAFLTEKFGYDFVVENKADSKYEVVSGASIVAKVIRDAHFEDDSRNRRMIGSHWTDLGYSELYASDKQSCGSGYPSDPDTKQWLKCNFRPISGFSRRVRHSWETVKKLLMVEKKRELKSLPGFYLLN
ncbi:RNH2A [Enterospora canceri]|uniref:Ribonuclease n=1 Tax=Enterospora canceri TaxID=1081671 RepID=A0A1Y1S840_9MICR|nr:RNH2A [Enterospora canceri]